MKPTIYWIDLFCGAGGTTTGIHLAGEGTKVVACVNHDKNAIRSHQTNHPACKHFIEDIRKLDLSLLKHRVECIRKMNPKAIIAIWASLECTNYSKAKGGLPRDADSRTLANHLFRYIEAIDPDYLWIENVVEFMAWGPLDDKGKPLSRKNGIDYIKWIQKVQSYGYGFDYQIMNSADFGAYTSRKRYFGQFAKKGLPISWPDPTHSKNPTGEMFGRLKKWKAVKDVLDLSDEGASIFNREKDLVDNTLKRVLAGLQKFAGHRFIQQNYSGHPKSKVKPLDQPAGTITCIDHHSVVNPLFMLHNHGGDPKSKVWSLDRPTRTVTSRSQYLIAPAFLQTYYGNGGVTSVDDPSPTVTTKDRIGVVQFFVNAYSGGGQLTDINKPSPTIMGSPKSSLTTASWILNPQYSSKGSSIEVPCPTVIARQDKMPLYLMRCKYGTFDIPVYETDSEVMIEIKKFMADHGIVDIKMRMLKIEELLRIMGFPEDYVLIGTKAEQKKFIGNAVEVNMACALVASAVESIEKHYKLAA